MTLADLIARLEAADPAQVVRHGFTNPHSYRGDYMDLAFEPASHVTVADMLASARSALGTTYQGYKGGDFTMGEHTWCWLSTEGDASGETIGALLLDLMLAPAVPAGQAPATDQTAPVDWIDGHPQLEAIAASVWEHCRTEGTSLVVDDPRNIAVAALAAVLSASVDRAGAVVPAAEDELTSERDRLITCINRVRAALNDCKARGATDMQYEIAVREALGDRQPHRGPGPLCHETDPKTLRECALRAGHEGDHQDGDLDWSATPPAVGAQQPQDEA